MRATSRQLGMPGGQRVLPGLKVRAAASEPFPAPALPLRGAPAGETTHISAPAAARFRHALGGGERAAGERTAAAAAPCAGFTLLLGCFAESSLTSALLPHARRGARLLPAGSGGLRVPQRLVP